MLLQTPANAGVFLWSIRSSQKPRIPTTYSLFLWDDSNGLDLHQVVRLRQSRHEHYGDQRRVGPATPHALKYFKGRHRRLTLHNVDVPLDDVNPQLLASLCSPTRCWASASPQSRFRGPSIAS